MKKCTKLVGELGFYDRNGAIAMVNLCTSLLSASGPSFRSEPESVEWEHREYATEDGDGDGMQRNYKLLIVAGCLAVVLALVVSCADMQQPQEFSGGDSPMGTLDFSEGSLLYLGDAMLVLLSEDSTTGDRWDSSILGWCVALEGDEHADASENAEDPALQLAGDKGSHAYSFKANGTGVAMITLTCSRGEGSSEPDARIVIIATAEDGVFTKAISKEF